MNAKKIFAHAALTTFLLSGLVQAQPGPGPGMGPGAGYGRSMQFDSDNATGWGMMSAEERKTFHDKMMSAKTYTECSEIQRSHHADMVARATERGMSLVPPPQNACERMKERGFYP